VVLEASAKSSAAILTSLTKNLTIEDPTDVGFLTGFGAVILVDVATQGRKAPVAQLTRQKPQHQKENGNDL
jgi:hypothetical protein